MRDLLPTLATIAALGGAAAGGLVSWALKLWWEIRVNAASQKALAQFKHSLDNAAANASYDYQRRLQDFNLFVAKKHEVLAELHKRLLDATSQIVRFSQGGRDRALLLDTNADDASDYLENHAKIPRGKRAEILGSWETDREESLRLLYEYQDVMQGEHARRAWVKANNYRLGCDVYLPEQISQAAETLVVRLERLRVRTELEKPGAPKLYQEGEDVRRLFEELKSLTRTEMARSEFS